MEASLEEASTMETAKEGAMVKEALGAMETVRGALGAMETVREAQGAMGTATPLSQVTLPASGEVEGLQVHKYMFTRGVQKSPKPECLVPHHCFLVLYYLYLINLIFLEVIIRET